MRKTLKVLILFLCAALLISLAPFTASAADATDSLVFFYAADKESKLIGSTYWNGIVVENPDGKLYVIGSYLSALDSINVSAEYIIMYTPAGGGFLVLEDYDTEAGIAIYSIYGEVSGVEPMPLTASTSVATGDDVTLYGIDWTVNGESFDELIFSYSTTVASAAASQNQNYIYMKLTKAAPNPYWENAAVMNDDGFMVGVLLSSTDMNYVLPSEYIMGYLGYDAETTSAGDAADLGKVDDAIFTEGSDGADADAPADGDSSATDTPASTAPASPTTPKTLGSSRAGLYTAIWIGAGVIVAALAFFLIRYYLTNAKKNREAIAEVEETEVSRVVVPEVPGRYFLLARGGEHTGERFPVEGSLTIGRRAESCDIVLSPSTYGISGEHCRVDLVDKNLELTDLGSTFGTYFEGARLDADAPILLGDGDAFCLADPKENMFVVQFVPDGQDGEAEADEATEASDEAAEAIDEPAEAEEAPNEDGAE